MATRKRRYKVNLDELITVIRQYPFLFDPCDPGYKDNVLKENWWQAIAEQFSVPTNIIQKKWRSLKDRYIRERRVYYTKKKIYENRAYINPPKWRLYPILESLLEKTLKLRRWRTPMVNFTDDSVKNSENMCVEEEDDDDDDTDIINSYEADDSINSHSSTQITPWNSGSNGSDIHSRSSVDSQCLTPTIIISSPPENVPIKIEPGLATHTFPPTPNSDETGPNSVTITPIPTLASVHIPQTILNGENHHRIASRLKNMTTEEDGDYEEGDETDMLHSIHSTLSRLDSRISAPFSHSEDELHYYAMSLSQRLRKLSDKNRHIFKIKVEEILYELEQS